MKPLSRGLSPRSHFLRTTPPPRSSSQGGLPPLLDAPRLPGAGLFSRTGPGFCPVDAAGTQHWFFWGGRGLQALSSSLTSQKNPEIFVVLPRQAGLESGTGAETRGRGDHDVLRLNHTLLSSSSSSCTSQALQRLHILWEEEQGQNVAGKQQKQDPHNLSPPRAMR